MSKRILLSLAMLTLPSASLSAQDAEPMDSPILEPLPTIEPAPEESPALPAASPLPSEEPPAPTPDWTYRTQTQNADGTVTNTHRYMGDPAEGDYTRQHIVTNPRGEMVQSWQRVETEDGVTYRRTQTWRNPDGTLRREHEMTRSETEQGNLSREHRMTLPDGRTMERLQTGAGDRETGTVERPFAGANGHTRETAKPSTPGKPSWLESLNPFRSRGGDSAASAQSSSRRRGFTIGTANRASRGSSMSNRPEPPSLQGSGHTRRPSWAGSAARATRAQWPDRRGTGVSTANRPSPPRGPKR